MSNFKLTPVPQSQLSCMEKLLDSARREMKMEKRSDVAYTLARVEDGYDTRSMAAYVDSLEDPKHCLILATLPGIVTVGHILAVVLIYSHPKYRNPESAKVMLKTVDSYASINGITTILGSSWLYGCDKPIDSLWKDNGYVPQETTYVKLL